MKAVVLPASMRTANAGVASVLTLNADDATDSLAGVAASNARTDLKVKLALYHQHRVRPYWIVDPERETLTVHRWAEGGYLVTMVATRGDVVRADPFEAIELRVGLLFGDDLDDASTGS